jgi:hypothetical protein
METMPVQRKHNKILIMEIMLINLPEGISLRNRCGKKKRIKIFEVRYPQRAWVETSSPLLGSI